MRSIVQLYCTALEELLQTTVLRSTVLRILGSLRRAKQTIPFCTKKLRHCNTVFLTGPQRPQLLVWCGLVSFRSED